MKYSYYGKLDKLDHSRGGIKETYSVKNKDALLQIDIREADRSHWKAKISELIDKLIDGEIRTLTVIDKNGSNV